MSNGADKLTNATKRGLKAIPNSLTLCNSLCGFGAILYTLRVYERVPVDSSTAAIFAGSAWLILSAMIFDALDGFAARLFNASSMHGIQMDSLADMVTFGVAPATVMAILTHKLRGTMTRPQEFFTYLWCAVYLGGAALRLATYNVHAIIEKKSDDVFSGLPSPSAAAAVCSVVLFAEGAHINLDRIAPWLPVYAAVLGLLMVSPVPYIHFGKWLVNLRRHPKQSWLLAVIILTAVLFRGAGILVMITLYVLSGPAVWLCGKIVGRRLRPLEDE